MATIDLHIHSSCSDGSLTVEEIIKIVQDKGIKQFSITDHDTFMAYNQIHDSIEGLVCGIEISAYDYDIHKNVHILAYGMKTRYHIEEIIKPTLKQTSEISLWQIQQLQDVGYPITESEVLKQAKESSAIYKQHIMQVLIDKNIADSIYGEFYQVHFKNEGICVHEKVFPDIRDVIKAIHKDQGLAVLAHPEMSGIIGEIPKYISWGIDGLETYHSSQSNRAKKICNVISKEYNLIETGGSDCHGIYGNEPMIGDFEYEKEELICTK